MVSYVGVGQVRNQRGTKNIQLQIYTHKHMHKQITNIHSENYRNIICERTKKQTCCEPCRCRSSAQPKRHKNIQLHIYIQNSVAQLVAISMKPTDPQTLSLQLHSVHTHTHRIIMCTYTQNNYVHIKRDHIDIDVVSNASVKST